MNKKIDFKMNSLRILAIVLVILLHSNAMLLQPVADGKISIIQSAIIITISVITRIAVPLFVLISGRYVIQSLANTNIKEFYLKRVPRLIIPMIFWSIIFFGICLIGMQGTTLISYLKDVATGFAHNMAAIHIWYLYMLLGLYLVSPLIYKFIKNMNSKNLIVLGIILTLLGFGVEIVKNITQINIWILWWMEFLGLFIMGYATREIKITKKKLLLIISLLIEIISSVVCCILLSSGNSLGMVFFWGLTPTTTATAILIYMYFNNLNLKENIVANQAKYVLGIYLFHPIVLILMNPLTCGIAVIDVIGKTIIAFFISLIIMKLLYKIKIMRKFIS
ncbi:MAG: acyltransferase [Clostridium sp.]